MDEDINNFCYVIDIVLDWIHLRFDAINDYYHRGDGWLGLYSCLYAGFLKYGNSVGALV